MPAHARDPRSRTLPLCLSPSAPWVSSKSQARSAGISVSHSSQKGCAGQVSTVQGRSPRSGCHRRSSCQMTRASKVAPPTTTATTAAAAATARVAGGATTPPLLSGSCSSSASLSLFPSHFVVPRFPVASPAAAPPAAHLPSSCRTLTPCPPLMLRRVSLPSHR